MIKKQSIIDLINRIKKMSKKTRKKIILSTIVVVAYILSFIFASIAENVYSNADPESTYNIYETYIAVDYSFAFILSTPFFIILIAYFRHHRDLMWFAIISMISSLGLVLYNILSFSLDPGSLGLRLFSGISYFGAVANIFLAFKIILQEKYETFINRAFLLFAVINYGFFSFYTPYIKNFLAVFVGPYPHFLRNTFLFYDYFYLFLQLSMVVVQIVIISFFIDNKGFNRTRIY